MPAFHPSPHILEAFAYGKLADTVAADTVLQHLETCVDCRDKVSGMSGDTFLQRMRDARPSTNAPGPDAKPRPSSPFSDLPPELRDNQQYEVLRELGRGGMGVVYLAKNRLMDRHEVLKVITASMLQKSGTLDRFLREIRSAAALSHDNVVKAYSAMQFGDALVFAMEYVEGDDLAKLVKKQGPLAVANACYYARQVALGLQHAHERGMVHRDIKPHNLILARAGKKHSVKILDFGLAKASSEKKVDTRITQFGAMLGTPDYIAPEQILDAATADIRADIYSLGCTLYYLLTGAPPFGAGSLLDLLQAHQTTIAQPLNILRADVPVALSAIVATMMAKDPAKRYQKPAEVAQALMPFFMKQTGSHSETRISAQAAHETFTPVANDPPHTPVAESPGALRPAAPTVVMEPAEQVDRFAFDAGPLVQNPLAENARRRTVRKTKKLALAALAVAALCLAGVYWGFGLFVPTPQGTIGPQDLADRPDAPNEAPTETLKLDLSLVHVFRGHAAPVKHIVFTPDGSRLISASNSNFTRRANGSNINDPGGDNTVRVWSLESGAQIRKLFVNEGIGYGPQGIGVSPDGRLVAACTSWDWGRSYAQPKVFVWDMATGTRKHYFPLPGDRAMRAVGFSKDGKTLHAYRCGTGVHSWSLASLEMTTIDLEEQNPSVVPFGTTFTAGCRYVIGGSWKQAKDPFSVNIWDRETGKLTKTFLGHKAVPACVAMSFDEALILSCSPDFSVRIWEVVSGRQILCIDNLDANVRCVAVSPSAKLLLTGGEDKTVRLWDISTSKQLARLEGHTDVINCVAFSRDGAFVASGSNDATVRLWRLSKFKASPSPLQTK